MSCDRASELHCFDATAGGANGVNPLLGAVIECFDSDTECTHTAPDGKCRSTPAHWYCSAMQAAAGDPLAGYGFCQPTLALCDAARASPAGGASSPCTPAETVYCEAGQPLRCGSNEAQCNRAVELVARIMPGGKPHGPCVPRHSAH